MSLSHSSNKMITAMCLIKMNTRNHFMYGLVLNDISMGYYVRINHRKCLQSVYVKIEFECGSDKINSWQTVYDDLIIFN